MKIQISQNHINIYTQKMFLFQKTTKTANNV